MFFFFGFTARAYTCITTKTPKKAIREIGFGKWMEDTAAYKSLVSALPRLNVFKQPVLESDGLDRKNIDRSANLYCDVMSSHSKDRIRLNYLISEPTIECIYINDIHVLGDTIEEITDIYERCSEKGKGLCLIDNTTESRVSRYSLCSIIGEPYPLDKRLQIIQSLSALDKKGPGKSGIGNARGTNKITLTENFWNAYFLYEVTMEIPEDIAVILSGMSKNSFHAKCLEIEENYDQWMLKINGQHYTYEEMLAKTLESKKMSAEQFYSIPKRFGVLPSSDKITFNEIRSAMTKSESDGLDLPGLQTELDALCAKNNLPKMLYFNYKRYCAKQDNPSKRTFSKFFHYDMSKINAYQTFYESYQKAADLMNIKDIRKTCQKFVLDLYGFSVG